MEYSAAIPSPLGPIVLASEGTALTGLWLRDQKHFIGQVKAVVAVKPGLEVFRLAGEWLESYFAGDNPDPAVLPLAPAGSGFSQLVWTLLRSIPYGGVTTYGALAKETASRLGVEKMSALAVGGAVGHNPISIIIPCHRVVGSNGSLTGYGGGIANKVRLLELDGVDLSKFTVPTKGTAL